MPQPKWKCGAKKKKNSMSNRAVIFAVFLYKGIKDCNYNPERAAKNCHVGQLNHQKNDSDGQKNIVELIQFPGFLERFAQIVS